jgi:GT2 family glycosyltransferase
MKSDRRRAESCFVIATHERPDYLLNAVRSLVEQTVLPRELCIIDSSAETPARGDIEKVCADVGLAVDYVHPAPRGLPAQRNLGIDRTTGDPVFLIDDDIWMAPNAHDEVLAEYDRWGPELGGVRGVRLNPVFSARSVVLWRRLFGMGGWWPDASGKMRASFCPEVPISESVRTVEHFSGWFMSYRREVFEHERFDERLGGYAYREDSDFSYRVAKRGYVLVQTPKARADHLKASSQRLSPFDLQRMELANHFYLHRKNMPQTFRYKAALWWAILGTLVLYLGKAIQTRDRGYVTGLLVGAWEQARGRGLIDPNVENDGSASKRRL